MDYLEQALERFKRMQPDETPPSSQAAKQMRQVPPPIVYTATKTIEPASDTLRRSRLIAGFEGGPFVDAYKLLRAQVTQRLRENGWNVVGVTSPARAEGKTLTAVNLSLALAMDLAQTVLLVDADLRHPSVHRVFGLSACPGLSEHLFDGVPLQDLLLHPGTGRLVFLPGGRAIANSAEALASPRMAALVEDLRHRYPSRVIVFDLPPVTARADSLELAPRLDSVLVVAEEGRTEIAGLEQAAALLKGRVPILGAVLNKAGRGELSRKRAVALLSH